MFNWWTFIFEIINFIVVVYILYRLLFKPVREVIAKREEQTLRLKKEIDREKDEIGLMKAEISKRMEELDEQKRTIAEEIRTEALKERETMLQKAREEIDMEREKLRRQIDEERSKLYEEIKAKAIEISADLSSRLISSIMDRHINEGMVDQVLDEIRHISDEEKAKIVDPSRKVCTVEVASPYPLGGDTMKRIKDVVTDKFQCIPTMEYHTLPELIGGIIIRINSRIFDGTIKGNLERIVSDLKERI